MLAATGAAQADVDGAEGVDRTRKYVDRSGSSATLVFDLEFQHRLTNKTDDLLANIRVYVPVPADCYQQKVTGLVWLRAGQQAECEFHKDQYGQPVASFLLPKLPAGGTQVVGFRCRAALRCPRRVVLPKPGAKSPAGADELEQIPQDLRARYTQDLPGLYGLSSPIIRKHATELAAGRELAVERVRAIYEFVAQGLTYKREGGWDSAPQVLARRNGSCSEFSYVFSALCRASGIPTRFVGASMFRKEEVTGYPYVDNVWHRWVQVYLPGLGWVHMDPTRDRGRRAKDEHFGRQPGPSLVVSHHGGESRYLGDHYVSADNQSSRRVRRARRFLWTPASGDAAAGTVTANPPSRSQSPQR